MSAADGGVRCVAGCSGRGLLPKGVSPGSVRCPYCQGPMEWDAHSDLLIWWVDETGAKLITAQHAPECELPASMEIPGYIREEYRDRYGRAGRGRLWVNAEEFKSRGDIGVDVWPSTPLGALLSGAHGEGVGEDFGGIVIRREHAAALRDLPGIITDFTVRRA